MQNISIEFKHNHCTIPNHLSFQFKNINAASGNRKQVVSSFPQARWNHKAMDQAVKMCSKNSMLQDKPDYYERYTVNSSSHLFCMDANSHEMSFIGLRNLLFLSCPLMCANWVLSHILEDEGQWSSSLLFYSSHNPRLIRNDEAKLYMPPSFMKVL